MNDLSNILHRCNNVKRTRDKYLHALHNVYDDKVPAKYLLLNLLQ